MLTLTFGVENWAISFVHVTFVFRKRYDNPLVLSIWCPSPGKGKRPHAENWKITVVESLSRGLVHLPANARINNKMIAAIYLKPNQTKMVYIHINFTYTHFASYLLFFRAIGQLYYNMLIVVIESVEMADTHIQDFHNSKGQNKKFTIIIVEIFYCLMLFSS